jgi:hypothetical protein
MMTAMCCGMSVPMGMLLVALEKKATKTPIVEWVI